MKNIFLIHVIVTIRNWTCESMTFVVTVIFMIKFINIIQVGACIQYLRNMAYAGDSGENVENQYLSERLIGYFWSLVCE